jgi:NAD+ kinase
MIRAAGIISKPIESVVSGVVPPLIEWLRARQIDVYVDNETRDCIRADAKCVARERMAEHIELLIVLGGDGTLLSAARAIGAFKVPILAVNLGGLGFLTSVTLEELFRKGASAIRQLALNDAVANKGALSRMLEFDVYVDRDHVGRYRADGLIVATPTGSTAYSLAAGGPVVHPDLDAFVITPICPHMLTNRPFVIPGSAKVEIDFAPADEPVYLTLDGQIGFELEPADRVAITKSSSKVVYVRPPRKTYFEILRSKLRWGER